jgi:tRNA threonylcarbamoyl adenosine modification protein YeaZ
MNILALDTSSRFASIAVLNDDRIQLEYNFSSEDNLSSLLIPSLQFLLKSLKLKPEDIDVFGIGIGPGLFTGIRIGLATLKGMLFGLRKPFVPVVTLHALAFKFVDSVRSIIPLIDAKRNEVYMGCYRSDEGGLVEAMEPALLGMNPLLERIRQCEDKIFVGSGAETYRNWLRSNFKDGKLFYRSHFLASEIGKIAFQQYRNKNFQVDLQKLLPFYLRKPDAETALPQKRADPN